MSKLEKLWIKIKNNPKSIRFEELDKILISEGFKKRQPKGGSSHYTYAKDGLRVTVPYKKPYILHTYVKIVINAIEGGVNGE